MSKILNKDKNLTRLLAVFIICLVFFGITQREMFLSANNFQSMGKLFPEYGLLSIGMALALLTGGIDLSVVYIANVCAVVIALIYPKLVTETTPTGTAYLMTIVCVLLAVLIGAVCGILNGFLISVVRIPPILATLGTQSLFQGVAVVLTGGSTLSGFPQQLSNAVNAKVIGIPVTALIFVLCAFIVGFIISRTTLGYKIRMLGTNAKACAYSGFNNVKLMIINYMTVGILASIAGVIMIGRFNSAKADYGSSYTMQAIMIAVMGGVSPEGGKGNIQGVCVAVLIIQMVSSWLNMYEQVSNFYRQIIWGVLLIFVLILNHVINKREVKRAMQG